MLTLAPGADLQAARVKGGDGPSGRLLELAQTVMGFHREASN
jgi:hypothetical protein